MRAFSEQEWQRAADFVLPVLIGEPSANGGMTHTHFWKAVAELGLTQIDFPSGAWRETFLALSRLILSEQVVHHVILSRELAGRVSDDVITAWRVAYGENSELRGDVFSDNVRALRDFGERSRLLHDAGEYMANIKRGLPLDTLNPQMITQIAVSGTETLTGETAQALGKDFEEMVNQPPPKVLMSGVDYLDRQLKGLLPDSLVAIVGRMKQRKTSLVLNILLRMAIRNQSVSILMFESNRRLVTCHCIAMLACRWLAEQELYGKGKIGTDGKPLDVISPEELYKFRGLIHDWDATRQEAVKQGSKQFAEFGERFRIYDRTKKGGALSDINSVRRIALRDKMLYKTDVMALDHVQRVLVAGARGDYEKMAVVAPYLEELAKVQEICLLALSQRTAEEDIDGQYRSGARGGTGLDEAADTTVTVGYRLKGKKRRNMPESEPLGDDKLVISTHLSRWSKSDTDHLWAVTMDPATGWILNNGVAERVYLG